MARLTISTYFDKIFSLSSTQENNMLQDIDTQTVTLTPLAAKAVQDILAERKLDGYALRVYVAGGGCCGVNFGMALDNQFGDADTSFEAGGVKVVVDRVSLDYLRGATVDFVNDPTHGTGFTVDSPNLPKHEHEHGEGGCGCGGSCACKN
jgi:iron-sulfur cluster assembly accessory protein